MAYHDLGPDCASCHTDMSKERERITGHKENGEFKTFKFIMCGKCTRFWKQFMDDNMPGKCPHKYIMQYAQRRKRGQAPSIEYYEVPYEDAPSRILTEDDEPDWLQRHNEIASSLGAKAMRPVRWIK